MFFLPTSNPVFTRNLRIALAPTVKRAQFHSSILPHPPAHSIDTRTDLFVKRRQPCRDPLSANHTRPIELISTVSASTNEMLMSHVDNRHGDHAFIGEFTDVTMRPEVGGCRQSVSGRSCPIYRRNPPGILKTPLQTESFLAFEVVIDHLPAVSQDRRGGEESLEEGVQVFRSHAGLIGERGSLCDEFHH